MSRAALPLWRSALYVPVIVERFVDKAHERGADAVILDLEDSIPPVEKPRARSLVAAAAAKVAGHGTDVLVRLNRSWRMCMADLEACVVPAVRAVVLPKVADASHVRFVAEVLDDLEAARGMAPGSTGIIGLIETPDALFDVRAIAGAHPRLMGLTLGPEDFALAAGMLPTPEGLFQPTLQVALACAATGILPLGFVGSIADFTDIEGFRAIVRQARRLGLRGAACIHPAQVAVLNEEFAPSAAEIEDARDLIATFVAALSEGVGAVSYKGKMIDIPVVERARTVLAVADVLRERAQNT